MKTEITQEQLAAVSDAVAYDWLRQYNKDFHWLLQKKADLARWGSLFESTLNGVKKCYIREQQAILDASRPENDASFTIKQGTVFKVPKYLGEVLAEKVGLPRLHRQFEVLNVLAEDFRGYKLEIRASGKRMSTCSICGRSLTDAYSVQHGVGPTCAKKYGVLNSEQLDLMLTEQAKPVVVEIKRWQVQNPMVEVADAQ